MRTLLNKIVRHRMVLGILLFVALNHLIDGGPFDLLVTVHAQAVTPTAVSGTIVDPNGTPYSGATVNIQLAPTPPGPAYCGTQQIQALGTTTTNASGFFQINLCPNASITPLGSQWQFNVAISPGVPLPLGTGPQQFSVLITIAGASQNVSAALSAAAPKLANLSTGSGTVTSVNGTANQIDVSNPTTTPVASLDPAIILPGTLTAPSGTSIGVSGTGTNNATSISGVTITGVPAIGNVPIASSSTAAVWGAQGTNPTVTNGNLFVSPGCPQPSAGNCIFTPANTIQLGDVVTTISTTINSASANFQCPGAVYPCSTGGDTGKEEFGTSACNGAIQQTLTIPEGQIVTVNTAHQAVLSVAATAAGSGNCFAYGSLDDTALTLADTTAQAAAVCFSINLPPGLMSSKLPHFYTQPGACARLIQVIDASSTGTGLNIGGAGPGPTTIVVYPGMNMQSGSPCIAGVSNTGCWGGIANAWFHDMGFTSLGYNRTGLAATKNFFNCTDYMRMSNMIFDGLGGADSNNFFGVDVSPTTGPCEMDFIYNVGFGKAAFQMNGQVQTGYIISCCSYSTVAEISVTSAGIWTVNGSTFVGGTPSTPTNQALVLNAKTVRGGGSLYTFPNGATNPYIAFRNDGVVQLQNSSFATSTTSSASNIGFWNELSTSQAFLGNDQFSATGGNAFLNASGASFFDQGNNLKNLTGTFLNQAGGKIFSSLSITGTTQTSGNITPAGLGTGAAVSAVSGNSLNEQFTITIGTGPGANGTAAVVFPTAFFAAPNCTAQQTGGTSTTLLPITVGTPTTTGVTLTYFGTFVTGTVITNLVCSN